MIPLDPLLATVLAAVGLQRLFELAYARHTAAKLVAHGARLIATDGMGFIVAVHAAWFIGCISESLTRGTSYGWAAAGLILFALGLGLRIWSMVTLGDRWNTRVYVLPQAPLVATGPYRFLRHPIYIGVWLELVGLPAAFGLWWTTAGVAVLNGAALLRRIRLEERALGLGSPAAPSTSTRMPRP